MQSVEFVLGSSRLLLFFLGVVYFSAIIILISCPLLAMFKIIGALLLVRNFWQLVNLHVKRSAKKSVVYLWQDSLGRWGCLTHQKKAAVGVLKGDSFKSGIVLILRFRFKAGTRNVIVPVDALNKAEYRQLYTHLSL